MAFIKLIDFTKSEVLVNLDHVRSITDGTPLTGCTILYESGSMIRVNEEFRDIEKKIEEATK